MTRAVDEHEGCTDCDLLIGMQASTWEKTWHIPENNRTGHIGLVQLTHTTRMRNRLSEGCVLSVPGAISDLTILAPIE